MLSGPASALAQDGVPKPEELFQRLDKDGDGKVTKEEVPEEQRRFFDRSVRVGDKDGDGALTKDEFLQASKPPEAGGIPLNPQGGPGGNRLGDARQRFDQMDRNKDGKVTLDEVPEPIRDRAKPIFDRLGKTELTFEDWARGMGGGPDGRPEPGALFGRLDKNGDGKLTKEEVPDEFKERMAQAFERLGTNEITREQFVEMSRRLMGQPGNPDGQPRPAGDGLRFPLPAFFRQLDANNDGRLSKDELSKAADKFADLDENSDGQLDPRELMGPPPGFAGGNPEMRRPGGDGAPNVPAGLGPFFAQLDKNGDGKLSKDEAPERMKDAFGRMDKDGDGFLTAEELRDAAGRFPGRPGANRPDGEGSRPRRPAAEDKKPE
ncbi:MAG TPA: EF-hand domain-containing protein [Planctomycetaceae bacterium]|nr:EF-hand domain-containing protein [Planctomycetaceae bacterium]